MLVEGGERLMFGRFDAPQPGPLLIVPFLDGSLPCGVGEEDPFLVLVGDGAAVTFLSNATHVLVAFETAKPALAAAALDTHAAHRTLTLMTEEAVALHAMGARLRTGTPNSTGPDFRAGVLGLPYALPGPVVHRLAHPVEGFGIRMAYEEGAAPVAPCDGPAGGLFGVTFLREDLPESLEAGSVVHAVVVYDDASVAWLPRPVDETSHVFQANLYLARPGESVEDLRRAFDPRPGPHELVPAAGLLVGLALMVRTRR